MPLQTCTEICCQPYRNCDGTDTILVWKVEESLRVAFARPWMSRKFARVSYQIAPLFPHSLREGGLLEAVSRGTMPPSGSPLVLGRWIALPLL